MRKYFHVCLILVTLIIVRTSLLAALEERTEPVTTTQEQSSFAGAETCATCHENEFEEWNTSKHARAFSKSFERFWQASGEKKECLACHTTGFEQSNGTYVAKGVSCESCHGALKGGHPDSEKMLLPTEAETCKSCHQNTYKEWKLSTHGQKDIRCFDCHQVHKQGLRQPSTELHCGSCHPQKLEDFTHATHHFQGLTCATCHMPMSTAEEKIGGTGAPSHSFFVGVETCAACHDEMVHKSHKIPSLTQEVAALTQRSEVVIIEELEARLRSLELQLDIQTGRIWRFSILALILGLFLGTLLALIGISRKSGKDSADESK